jgi:hypothetical protein
LRDAERQAIVAARKHGILPEDCFMDNSMRIIDIDDDLVTLEKYIDFYMAKLKNAHLDYLDTIP